MITQEQAVELARQHAGPKILSVTDRPPEGCNLYGPPQDCWYAVAEPGHPNVIQSSRLICISKNDGRVLYDGPAQDEG